MKSMKLKAVTLGVGAALVASLGTAQAASVSECRALVGFKSDYAAWGAVQNNEQYFVANNRVNPCVVKLVLPSAKGKPGTDDLVINREMAKDACSMYNYLSSIDSKLDQAKVNEAYVIVSDMHAKLNSLLGTGKLEQAGYDAITPKVTEVQSCIYNLMSQ